MIFYFFFVVCDYLYPNVNLIVSCDFCTCQRVVLLPFAVVRFVHFQKGKEKIMLLY